MGYGCPSSTDGGIVHRHDSVQPEAGKIAEDVDFDLSVVHRRVSEHYSNLYNRRDQRSLRAPAMCMTHLQNATRVCVPRQGARREGSGSALPTRAKNGLKGGATVLSRQSPESRFYAESWE